MGERANTGTPTRRGRKRFRDDASLEERRARTEDVDPYSRRAAVRDRSSSRSRSRACDGLEPSFVATRRRSARAGGRGAAARPHLRFAHGNVDAFRNWAPWDGARDRRFPPVSSDTPPADSRVALLVDAGAREWLRGGATPARVLDIGCGAGYFSAAFCAACPDVRELVGIDIDAALVARARKVWEWVGFDAGAGAGAGTGVGAGGGEIVGEHASTAAGAVIAAEGVDIRARPLSLLLIQGQRQRPVRPIFDQFNVSADAQAPLPPASRAVFLAEDFIASVVQSSTPVQTAHHRVRPGLLPSPNLFSSPFFVLPSAQTGLLPRPTTPAETSLLSSSRAPPHVSSPQPSLPAVARAPFSAFHLPSSFRLVFILKVSMWVHLLRGDAGLEQLLKRAASLVERDGRLIVQVTPWRRYGRAAARLTGGGARASALLASLTLRPDAEMLCARLAPRGLRLEQRIYVQNQHAAARTSALLTTASPPDSLLVFVME